MKSHQDTQTKMMLARHIRRVLRVSILAPLVAGSALGAPSVWQDYSTGFAIGGYDPVAYFTQNKATPGLEGIEHRWGGANWRFANTGNRDAFAKHPKIYAPRFAGYGALSVSKGLTVQGNPTLWALYRQRTYLFADKKNLLAWKRNRDQIIATARANWGALGDTLHGTSEK